LSHKLQTLSGKNSEQFSCGTHAKRMQSKPGFIGDKLSKSSLPVSSFPISLSLSFANSMSDTENTGSRRPLADSGDADPDDFLVLSVTGEVEGVAKVENIERLEGYLENEELSQVMSTIRSKGLTYQEVLGLGDADMEKRLEIEDVAVREKVLKITERLRSQDSRRGRNGHRGGTAPVLCCVIL